ncbi:MAG: hypothetical protein OZSIB_1132 [Candidatus Ozemobacter sibiricus]|uniref:Uncharacterized protein n=1 Tax=Candidatus Ozemobacter sibiricus TaxID=2268124 RepID=A0A367ZLZ8_9BACT|nr:MAG: hypothetical protein OZSIB_1132 [Candidatus Ozemobacter sibiricus]
MNNLGALPDGHPLTRGHLEDLVPDLDGNRFQGHEGRLQDKAGK